jgi:hypothetical protein
MLLASAVLACGACFMGVAEAVQQQAMPGEEKVSRARSRLRLILIDAQGLSSEASAALDRELTNILADAGVEADLVTPEQASGPSEAAHPTTLKVVLLAENGARFGVAEGHMGVNLVVEGRPGDTVYVFVPVVRQALARELRTGRRRAQERIGRALGRVSAHEIVHALAPEVPHASVGVMKASPNMRDLVAAEARLDPLSSERVRYALDRRVAASGR